MSERVSETGHEPTEDRERLAAYVETWWSAVGDLVTLLDDVPEEQWSTPTDLAGWDVQACAAHTAHLESVLAGRGEETAVDVIEIGRPAHVTGLMNAYTEIGVVNRRERTKADLLAELREVTTERHATLLADPPTDASAWPPVSFGGVPWTWEVMLRNRPLDVWMHEQDVRRALGRRGGYDSPAARHTIGYLAEGQGFVLAKRLKAPPGTTLVMQIGDRSPRGFAVDEDGRGRRLAPGDLPGSPTLRLRMDDESFVVLAGGRRSPEPGAVTVEGDRELGERYLSAMATTP